MVDSSPRGPGTVRSWQVAVAAGIILLLTGTHLFLTHFQGGADASDYRQVAEHFIKSNSVIARELGKVTTIRQIGVGGDSVFRSHNTFDVTGKEKRGACHITLMRAENGRWKVEEATLICEGRVDSLNVKPLYFR